MSNYFTITLDTTGPANSQLSLEAGAQYATQQLITAGISCTDESKVGYQIKLWGDVDEAHNTSIKNTEATSQWITYTSTQQIKLSSGDGLKTIYLKIRDDVYNEGSQVSDTILLDTSLPVVTVSGPDVSKISKIAPKNVSNFSFQVNEDFVEYKIKIVAASANAHDTGTQIPTTGGSTNMSGVGSFPANTPINCKIYGDDLHAAGGADGDKIIKIFVKDTSGQWCA